MVPIPKYLNDIAVHESSKGEWTTFSLKCPCGCTSFFYSENRYTKEEEMLMKPYYDVLDYLWGSKSAYGTTGSWYDEQGRHHTWRLLSPEGRNGPKEDVIIPPKPFFSGITRITVKCADCGAEYVLFDSRYHGYDGVTGNHTAEELSYTPTMKQRRGGPISIQVKVENDETPESFRECTGAAVSDYSDAFSWIIVYKVANGKRTKIFEAETA